MNLTDVDDRTIAAARNKGVSLRQHVDPFAKAFEEDRDWLRILPAHEQPRATEYIPSMIRLIQGLLDKGVAYQGDDGSVYFSIASFPRYGQLSRLDLRELKAGASERVSSDEYAKEDARDFVLWKAARPEDEAVGAAWDAPFGRGRPGWHIECSAMALELIATRGTDVLDIHAGGVDLIFPHHEDEIAQSCAYTGREQFARYWMHGEFLNIRGEKMSKRFGNITTARDLRQDGFDPAAIRLLMFQSHYRQKLDLTDEALSAAQKASYRLGEFQKRLTEARSDTDSPRLTESAKRLRSDVTEALNADLNAPRAIAAMFTFMNEANAALDAGERAGQATLSAWHMAEAVLGITSQGTVITVETGTAAGGHPAGGASTYSETPPESANEELQKAWALHWALQRKDAKTRRDYSEADRIRALLRDAGWEVRDARDGSLEVVRVRRAS
jgi:cysteinyl-tRNA synthetase